MAYSSVSEVNGRARRELYSTLPAGMKGDLWALHLEYFLEDHPDLTPAQRAVVFEALGLITSGVFRYDSSSPEWPEIDKAIRHLEARAKVELRQLTQTAFEQLGIPEINGLQGDDRVERPVIGESGNVLKRPLRIRPQTYDCMCSTESDYCCFLNCPTSPTPTCHEDDNCTLVRASCGFLWEYACNGMCGA
jgi:hypothetical protein